MLSDNIQTSSHLEIVIYIAIIGAIVELLEHIAHYARNKRKRKRGK